MIRVLIADDSPTVRDVMQELVNSDPEMLVIGTAKDGDEVVRLAERLKPDLITMDISMPGLSGLEATRRIMERQPTPIVVVSILAGRAQMDVTFDAISAGAVDVLRKPDRGELLESTSKRRAFLGKLKSMVGIALVTRRGPRPVAPRTRVPRLTQQPFQPIQLIAVGASAGGPPTVADVLADLHPTQCPPVVLVQHIADGFGAGYAEWLDQQVPAKVVVAGHGHVLRPGHVYVAPDKRHMEVTETGHTRLHSALPVAGHRPSVTVLFDSVARSYGARAAGILLTGMGSDGATGLAEMRTAGAYTIAQAPDTCVVSSMPKAAIGMGAAKKIASPADLRTWVGGRRINTNNEMKRTTK